MRDDVLFSRIKKHRLMLVPVAVAIGVRVLGAAWLSHALAVEGKLHTHWMEVWLDPSLPAGFLGPIPSSWLYLFHAWDSGFYVSVARNGYYHPAYAFMPVYPALIRLFGWLVTDYWLAALLVTLIFSLGSLVIFQLLAGDYMSSSEALSATLLMATFPFAALFTTIAYSEAVFLFFSIAAWRFYRKGNMLGAALSSALTALTRLYGIVIVLPMLLDMARSRDYRKCLYLALPAFGMFSWLLFCFVATGDPLASWTDQAHWQQSGMEFGFVQTYVTQVFATATIAPTFAVALAVCIGLFALFMVNVWSVDKMLWAYAVSLFGLLMIFGSITSLPRFLTFIFPIWLTLRVRNPLVAFCSMAVFVPLTLVLWLAALQGVFIA